MKKLLFILLFLWLPSVAYADYTITEAELVRLDSNYEQLLTLANQSEWELTKVNNQLEKSQTELAELKQTSENLSSQLSELQNINEQQKKSLATANKYLAEYEKEVKRKQKILKLERNAGFTVALIAIIVAVAK